MTSAQIRACYVRRSRKRRCARSRCAASGTRRQHSGRRASSRGRKRQSDRAAEIGRRIPRELAFAEMIFGNALKEALHRHFGDRARRVAAQTKLLAGAEAKMALWPSSDIVDVRIAEFAPVTIAGAKGKCHLVADTEPLPV